MNGLAEDLHALVSAFRRDVADAVRKAVLAAATSGLQAKTPAGKKPNRTAPRSASRLARRGVDAIDAVKARVLAAITSQPGVSSEELRRRLGLDRRELALPLRQLVAELAVKATGVKRATRYFPAKRMTSRKRSKK